MNPFEILLIVLLIISIFGLIYNTVTKLIRDRITNKNLPKNDLVKDPNDIQNLINTVIKQKSRIKIKINNKGQSYISSIIKIESMLNSHTLIIDSLFPIEGNDKIQYSKSSTAEFNIKETDKSRIHIPYSFEANYIDHKEYENFDAIRLTFPKAINRGQKREYLRIEPSINNPLFIKFEVNNKKMTQKIENISAGGICFYTNIVKTILWPGKRIEKAVITLPDSSRIKCPIMVRSLLQNNEPVIIDGKRYFYNCGVQFMGISNNTRERIIKYVLEKERNELKRLNREFE